MPDCIFCKIISGEIPSAKVYEDNEVLAFEDINPQSPAHTIIIPKKHIASIAELDEADEKLAGKILRIAASIAKEKGLDNGYRVLTNCGEDGGQTVFHLHFHLLGGRKLNVNMG
jgi:histidine triad (HIT) family protein